MNTCMICGNPSKNGYCEVHHEQAKFARQIRKDLLKLVSLKNQSWQSKRALTMYQALSDEGRHEVSLMVAGLILKLNERSRLRGRTSRIGPLAALETIIGMIQANYL